MGKQGKLLLTAAGLLVLGVAAGALVAGRLDQPWAAVIWGLVVAAMALFGLVLVQIR
jgi:hypothetical protein